MYPMYPTSIQQYPQAWLAAGLNVLAAWAALADRRQPAPSGSPAF